MSTRSVREFFTKAQSNEALLKQLKAAQDTAALIRIAKGEGYEFTTEDLDAVNPPIRTEKLSDAKFTPPINSACSQSACDYTSYAKKCVDTVPQYEDA